MARTQPPYCIFKCFFALCTISISFRERSFFCCSTVAFQCCLVGECLWRNLYVCMFEIAWDSLCMSVNLSSKSWRQLYETGIEREREREIHQPAYISYFLQFPLLRVCILKHSFHNWNSMFWSHMHGYGHRTFGPWKKLWKNSWTNNLIEVKWKRHNETTTACYQIAKKTKERRRNVSLNANRSPANAVDFGVQNAFTRWLFSTINRHLPAMSNTTFTVLKFPHKHINNTMAGDSSLLSFLLLLFSFRLLSICSEWFFSQISAFVSDWDKQNFDSL